MGANGHKRSSGQKLSQMVANVHKRLQMVTNARKCSEFPNVLSVSNVSNVPKAPNVPNVPKVPDVPSVLNVPNGPNVAKSGNSRLYCYLKNHSRF